MHSSYGAWKRESVPEFLGIHMAPFSLGTTITQLEEFSIRLLIFRVGGGRRALQWVHEQGRDCMSFMS